MHHYLSIILSGFLLIWWVISLFPFKVIYYTKTNKDGYLNFEFNDLYQQIFFSYSGQMEGFTNFLGDSFSTFLYILVSIAL